MRIFWETCCVIVIISLKQYVECVETFLEAPVGGGYIVGDSVTLKCSIAGKTGACIWLKDGVTLSMDEVIITSDPAYAIESPVTNEDYFLVISVLETAHNGEYVCTTDTGLVSSPAILIVQDPSQSFRIKPNDTTAIQGNDATLYCSIDNKDGVLHWLHDGVSISNDEVVLVNGERTSIVGDIANGEFNLLFSPTESVDEGVYQCIVDAAGNSDLITSSNHLLTVLLVQHFRRQPIDIFATQFEDTILRCEVNYKKGILNWIQNGTTISNDLIINDTVCDGERYTIAGNTSVGEYNLHISNLQLEDSGPYQCKVLASGADDMIVSSTATLTVTDHDECLAVDMCGDSYQCINTHGSYQCLCLRPEGCDNGLSQDDKCIVDAGLYRCSCYKLANSTSITQGHIRVLPSNITNGPYYIHLYDNWSECLCYRCIMDVVVETGRELLQCHSLSNSIDRSCPQLTNDTSWGSQLFDVASIVTKPSSDDVIFASFDTVITEAINILTEDVSQVGNCNIDNCAGLTTTIDALGVSVMEEILTHNMTKDSMNFHFEDIQKGMYIELLTRDTLSSNAFKFPAEQTDFYATIQIPGELLTTGTLVIVSAIYEKPEVLVGTDNVGNGIGLLNSAIISTTISPALSETLPEDSPIIITFRHLYAVTEGVTSCEFLQFNETDKFTEQLWNSSGCKVYETNQTMTTCHCNHLTSFAVLMRVNEFEMDIIHEKALEIISLVGCSISLLSLTITILTFVILGRFTQERIIHINLCLAIAIGQVIFVSGIGAVASKIGCMVVAMLLHYFFTSVFCWMLVEGIQLYAKLIRVFESNQTTRMTSYFFVGWGIPFLIVVIAVAIDYEHYGTDDNCWLSVSSGLIWAFVGPALLVILVNVVFLGMVVRVISKLHNCAEDDKYTKVRASLKAAIVLLPLLGMTWLFGLLSVNKNTVFFEYMFAILNSLQGFFIFLFYCVNSSEVRAQLARKKQTIELTHGISLSSGPRYSSNQVRPNTTSEEISNSNIASRSSIRISLDTGIQEEAESSDGNLM
ncbi:uncharacterized protein LOC100368044 [Saccoglossus kowalevskii]